MKLPLVYVLGAVGIASSYNQRMLDPLTALISRDIAVDVSHIIALSPIFTLPYALGQPFLGPIADSVGKAKVLRVCLAVIFLATLASFFIHDYTTLTAARFITGIAAGGIIPVALALIADRTPLEQRQVAMSRFMLVIILGQLFAAPLSAWIAQATHWRNVLLLAVAVATVGFILLMWQVKPNASIVRPPFSAARAVATYREILRSPLARACYVAVFAEGLFIHGFMPHIAVFLEHHNAGGPTQAGYVLAGMGLGGVMYAFAVPRLVTRYDVFTLMRAGGVLVFLGLAGTALGPGWRSMALSYAAVGFGFYMLHSGLQARVTEVMPGQRASVVSLHAFFMFIGIALGPLAFGWAAARIGDAPTLLINAAGILTVTLLAVRRIERLSRPAQ